MAIEYKDLVGMHVLSGVEGGIRVEKDNWGDEEHCEYLKFELDGVTYLALEDPDDGYRSCCRDLVPVGEPCKTRFPGVQVLCRIDDRPDRSSLMLLDAENGELVLEVGTDYSDGYYPVCLLNYHPENMSCNKYADRGHGHWVAKDVLVRSPFAKNYFCSVCKTDTACTDKYCSHCGAIMDVPDKNVGE